MSNPKEPHFFGTDLRGYRANESELEYHNICRKDQGSIMGEASVFYLMSADAFEQIHAYNSDSKFVIMLRDPIEMIPSLHSQLVYTQDENIEDFSVAWNISRKRQNGYYVPKRARSHLPLQYRECAKYAKQLGKLKKYFNNDNLHIILFDEFKRDPRRCVSQVLNFLEIQDFSDKIQYKLCNPNTMNRSRLIARFLRHPPSIVVRLKRSLLGRGRSSFRDKLIDINTLQAFREPLDPDIKREIITEYREDVSDLSKLIGRPLTSWLS